MTSTHSTTVKTALILSTITLIAATASATPKLTGVSFDPAFISAGDRVDISANLRAIDYPDKTWNEELTMKAVLKPGNRLTRKYVTIEKSRDESIGFLHPQGVWNQKYQVKIHSNAPTGQYMFEIHIQYLKNGHPVEIQTSDGAYNATVIKEFAMPVDNEGVDLTANVQKTSPTVPRPGDNYVEISFGLTNTGNKPIEEIELRPEMPENIETSFSSGKKLYIGKLMEGKTASKTLKANLNEELRPGTRWIDLKAVYEDKDGNSYTETLQIPLRIEGKPDLELTGQKTVMKAGGTSKLRLKVKNTGEQDAEAVTARVIVERAQPFSLEDRSSYIGEIKAGKTGEAVLKISADSSAAQKTHQVKIELRANGDSEEGDNSVYTLTETKKVKVDGQTQSLLIPVGILAAVLVALAAGYRYYSSEGENSEE